MTPEEGYKEALKRIEEDKDIKFLDLNDLKLKEIPPEIFKRRDWRGLGFMGNEIKHIPPALGELTELTSLYLAFNEITTIPNTLKKLRNLGILILNNNKIKTIPDALGRLISLHSLGLRNNQITVIPDTLGDLTNLASLDLSDNEITVIPAALGRLTNLRELYLHGNPGLGIPAEVLGPTQGEKYKGIDPAKPGDILEYYFRTMRKERPLNEAKLILVGRGKVGKTSLVKKMIFNRFNPDEKKTEGINIERWEVPIEDEQVRLNVWDFGGQEIMHATHQFFLTERSLYLLVLNGREGGEDAEAEYWLKLITSFGGNSPVIIVLNKISEHAFDLNRNALLKKYPNIKGFVRTDCGDNTGIEQLKAAISKETSDLEELRVNFPVEWFAVKDKLAATKDNYLSFAGYRDLCAENGVTDEKDQDRLARFLNQLGIVLNYKDDPRLSDTHVLNPHWVTEGIYKVLNSKELEKKQGEIHLKNVSRILRGKDYPEKMVEFLFELMKKFDLCFTFPDDEQRYLVPELLPKNEPAEAESFDEKKCLNFQYHYPVLPEGILPRFITRTYHMSEGQKRWRSGVILQFEGCRALVKADAVEKKTHISIDGKSLERRRRLLGAIRTEFERIHGEIRNLEPKEMVPIPGLPDAIFPYTDLLVMEKQGLKDLTKVVGLEVITYNVTDLLEKVDLPGFKGSMPGVKAEKVPEPGGASVFFSYAHEDERYKDVLLTHLKILQRQNFITTWNDREIEAGENWREEIMKELERADIILLLVSPDFIASDFCYETEMKRALERDTNKEARVIPVIVRDCIWDEAPFAKLKALPKDGKPVKSWGDKDTAWKNVAVGIKRAADSFRKQ